MPSLRIDYFLAGLLVVVGLALFLGAAGYSWAAAAAFAALGLTDVLLTGVGVLVAAMTAVVGILVVADARADVAAVRAWQEINAEVAVIGMPVETAPAVRIDARYTVGPQDQRLRSILLSHRFIVPVPSLGDVGSAAAPCADAVAAGEVDGVRFGTGLVMADRRPAADRHPVRMAATSDGAFDCPPLPMAGTVKDYRGRGQRSAKRRVSKALLVANGGAWWDYPNRFLVDARRAPADIRAADVIVLADRSGRDGQPVHRDVAPVPATTAQPGCRGPPAGACQRQVSSGPGVIGKSFREKDQQGAKTPADPAVVDNLGDRVPVGAAELEVVETYLDDVLRDLLATVAAGQDHRKS